MESCVMITITCIARTREFIGIGYHGECDVSWGSDSLVLWAVASVNASKTPNCLGDASKCIEAYGGTINVAPDREILLLI